MKALRKLQDHYRLWLLQRAHKKVTRQRKMLGYHPAVSFGIMYDATSEDHYKHVTHLVRELQQDQKKVKTLGYVTVKKMPEHCFPKLTFEFCNSASFSWNQQPVAQNVKDFISGSYDVLIDLTPSYLHHIKYLSAVSVAKMRVGRYVEKYIEVYDLMLQVDDNNSIEETSGQVLHYLKMINNNDNKQE